MDSVPVWRQVIFWRNTSLMTMMRYVTNFDKILIKIRGLSFTKMQLQMSAKLSPIWSGPIALKNKYNWLFSIIQNEIGLPISVLRSDYRLSKN